jgi:hypothetical protein
MNDKLKGIWNKAIVAQSKHYTLICLGSLRKAMKISVLFVSQSRLEPTTSQCKSKSLQLH